MMFGMKRKTQVELVPDLMHCVETMAKREHQKLAKAYIEENKVDSESEEKIELLRSFLETANFKKLRKESEAYLLKGEKVKFILLRENGETTYRLVINR